MANTNRSRSARWLLWISLATLAAILMGMFTLLLPWLALNLP